MPQSEDAPHPLSLEILPIHFDVPINYIPLTTFIATAQQTEAIVSDFNEQFFAGELEYRVFVIPPKPGTFLELLGIAVLGVGAAAWAFLHSEVGKAFIKGLSGEEPTHWAEIAGKKIRERWNKTASDTNLPSEVHRKSIEETPEEVQQLASAIMVVESVKVFLVADVSKMRKIGIGPKKFRNGYEARNKFYEACLEDKEVKGLGFDKKKKFPIDRKDFIRLQVPLAPREEVIDASPWKQEIATLKVTSPNWDRSDVDRRWKAKDLSGRDRHFSVEDDHFWSLAGTAKLDPDVIDTLRVHWIYQGQGHQRRNARALRVLDYNGVHLAEPLNEEKLNALKERVAAEATSRDLFDE